MKEISKINYLKVIALFVVTIFVVLVLANNYKQKLQYERANQDIMGFLSNIKYEELSNYLIENHDGFIYLASSSDTSLDNFEEELKQYIIDNELEEYFVYLDSSSYLSNIYQEIKSNFFTTELSKRVISYGQPNIFVVKDGKIVDILYTAKSDISLDDVKTFVSIHEVKE